MFRHLTVALLAFMTVSCASLNPLDILNPAKPSLEVNAQVGKTNEQEKNNIKVEDRKTEVKQEADKITNDTNYTAEKIENITQGMSKLELIMFALLAGWAIPSPAKTVGFAKRVISDTINILVVTPIKAIADFILKVLGRK